MILRRKITFYSSALLFAQNVVKFCYRRKVQHFVKLKKLDACPCKILAGVVGIMVENFKKEAV